MCFFQHSRFADLIEAPVELKAVVGSARPSRSAIGNKEMVDKFGVGPLAEPSFGEATLAVWTEGKDER